MLIKEFLENVCNEIKYKPIREDISEELSLHIEEQKEEYIKNGLEEKVAEERAVSNMGEAEEIGKKLNKIHKPKFDWLLTFFVAILIGFGFLITNIKIDRNAGEGNFYLARHIIFLIIGLGLSIGIYFLDYRKIIKNYKLLYCISSFILLFTMMFGTSYLGIKYIRFAGNTINPVNICILIYICSFVGFIKNLNNKTMNISIGNLNLKIRIDILNLLLLSTISIFLIMKEKRITISLVLFLSYIVITTSYIILSPNRKSNLIKFYGTFVITSLILILSLGIINNGAYSNIVRRLEATYNYESDLNGNGWIGYQINNVLNNAQFFSKLDDMDNYFGLYDGGAEFALISIIANYGTIYSAIIIITVILFAIKIIYDCKNIKDETGKLLCIGFGSFILLQAILNILMNFNLIPIVALNLPFVSYGLNGLIVNMMMIAFILSIYRRKDILTKKEENNKKLKIKISFE